MLGRPTLKIQQTGTVNYQMSAAYNLSGAIGTLTYPSGHTVTHTYDQAGRLTTLSGNLGDGTTRTYASGLLYSPAGGLVKEQFGTTTPIYNKLFYNSRGQLAEIRASTSYTGPTDYDANRGAIITSYSNSCTGLCSGSSMSDNNGNLLKQDIQIPSVATRSQYFDYDSLNRLKSAREVMSSVEQWKQQFTYDRWGNRTIDTSVTYGAGINNKAFTVNTANNRLGVPVGQSGVMDYDAAGNLKNDTYTGMGVRTYDAENKMTQAADNTGQTSRYTYDGEGKRVSRQVASSQEEWQIYGFAGEVLAEYRASAPASSPQKEYGYRNGQLLVTATGRYNVALAANGAVATASSTATGSGFFTTGAINGNYRGPWGNGVEGWNDNTPKVIITATKGNSGFIVGHSYTLNADGTKIDHGVYFPPPIRINSQYGDEMALAMVKLYGSAAVSVITGGTGTLSIAITSAGLIADLFLPEDAPDPQLTAMAANITISPIADDWVTKGAHIKVDGVELKLVPSHNGEVIFKPVFSSDPPNKVQAAIQKAQAALADPAFRERLTKTVGRAVGYLGKGTEMARSKSAEVRFLLKALQKRGKM